MAYKIKSFKFNHKEFSFPEWEDNYFLDNVKENYYRLCAIYDCDIPFVSSDYPTLINTYEQLCKGVCKELLSIHKDKYKRNEGDYKIGHRFSMFSDIIGYYIPLSPSKEGYAVIVKNIHKMEHLYNDTRFSKHATFEEFQSDFRRFESQLARMMTGLSKEYEKVEAKEEEELANY